MRTFLYSWAALLLLFSFSVNSLAGEFATLKFIGFSKDGKYLAFEESGIRDGDGAFFSNTFFVDTVKNSYASAPIEILEKDTYDTAAVKRAQIARNKKARLTIPANLRKFKIAANNTGDLLLSHLPSDWSYNPFSVARGASVETVKFNNVVFANSRNDEQFYELTLKTLSAGEKTCGEAYKFELTLANKTTYETLPVQILQKDETVPERRECAFGYRIERVYFYEDKIAVFLQVYNQGFEGPSMRYIAVTAQLDYKPLSEYK